MEKNEANEIYRIAIEKLKRINENKSLFFFSDGATEFFKSRYPQTAYKIGQHGNTAYFITSEKFDYETPRRYTVRKMDLTSGEMDTEGEFNELTKSQANAELRRIGRSDNKDNLRRSTVFPIKR